MIAKIGIGIIILTFVLSSISPYVIIFTIPVFIIGVTLLWFSKKRVLTKILWTILPILLWYPALATFMFLYGAIGKVTAQKLDFIFSDGFKGNVIVVGNIPCGQPIIKKENREQLFVPRNGILLYQGELEEGYVDHKYYYQIENGELQPIPERADYMYFDSEKNQPATNITGVWLRGMGATTNSENDPTIEYSSMTLTVDSKDSISLHNNFQKEQLFQNTTDSMIRDCKKRKMR